MVKLKTMIILLVFAITAAVAVGYIAGIFFYNEYRRKTAYLEEHTRNKFKDIDKNLKELYVSLENSLDEHKLQRKELLSDIESIKEDLREWERGYSAALSRLRVKIDSMKLDRLNRMVENLEDNINEFRVKLQDMKLKIDAVKDRQESKEDEGKSVDLGRISIKEKDQK